MTQKKLLKEISVPAIETIKDFLDVRKGKFNDFFGDKQRLVVPMKDPDSQTPEFLSTLNKLYRELRDFNHKHYISGGNDYELSEKHTIAVVADKVQQKKQRLDTHEIYYEEETVRSLIVEVTVIYPWDQIADFWEKNPKAPYEQLKGKKKTTQYKFSAYLKKYHPEYLDWYLKHHVDISKLDFKTLNNALDTEYVGLENYSIVLSRHPIDIVRMSDHDRISSCHAEGQSYFKCALYSAMGNAAIAYAVSNSELEKITDMQQGEIFADPSRNVEGIVPLKRIFLRATDFEISDMLGKAQTRTVSEVLFPEQSIYGDAAYELNRDFHARLVKILATEQNKFKQFVSAVEEIQSAAPDSIKLVSNMLGGTYKDTMVREMLPDLLGVIGKKQLLFNVHIRENEHDAQNEPEQTRHQAQTSAFTAYKNADLLRGISESDKEILRQIFNSIVKIDAPLTDHLTHAMKLFSQKAGDFEFSFADEFEKLKKKNIMVFHAKNVTPGNSERLSKYQDLIQQLILRFDDVYVNLSENTKYKIKGEMQQDAKIWFNYRRTTISTDLVFSLPVSGNLKLGEIMLAALLATIDDNNMFLMLEAAGLYNVVKTKLPEYKINNIVAGVETMKRIVGDFSYSTQTETAIIYQPHGIISALGNFGEDMLALTSVNRNTPTASDVVAFFAKYVGADFENMFDTAKPIGRVFYFKKALHGREDVLARMNVLVQNKESIANNSGATITLEDNKYKSTYTLDTEGRKLHTMYYCVSDIEPPKNTTDSLYEFIMAAQRAFVQATEYYLMDNEDFANLFDKAKRSMIQESRMAAYATRKLYEIEIIATHNPYAADDSDLTTEEILNSIRAIEGVTTVSNRIDPTLRHYFSGKKELLKLHIKFRPIHYQNDVRQYVSRFLIPIIRSGGDIGLGIYRVRYNTLREV